MLFKGGTAKEVKIAYIGGGSRGWAWVLMSDLASCDKMSGRVALYDIDYEAAKRNEQIGKKFNAADGAKSRWEYVAYRGIDEALSGADFVVISILPGTFDEMHSDVHAPEEYGIYQSVGDTSGPGGIVRALRCVPMIEEIAGAVERNCPDAWVINYTNPMTVCIRTLYKTFPRIKAFGCCHEVFGTQKLLKSAYEEETGETVADWHDIKVQVTGVNHFTWLTKAQYRGTDLFPVYGQFCERYYESGYYKQEKHWMNDSFACAHRVKLDLFRRYGAIAAAGDRHLAEFCPGKWYLSSPEAVSDWCFGLTSVEWRKNDLAARLGRSDALISGEEAPKIKDTGEEGVAMMCAILGLGEVITNVNLPNIGQIPSLPLGAVVETNAIFRANEVTPVACDLPKSIYPLISKIVGEQEAIVEAATERSLEKAFKAFAMDSLVDIPLNKARELFVKMLRNTEKYLTEYDIDGFCMKK